MMRFKVTPIVGLPQFTGWSQIAENNLQYHTSFFSAFAISGKNAGSVGRAVSEQINNYRYKNLQELHEFVLELDELVRAEMCILQIAGVLIHEDKSICFTQNASIFLHRGEKSGVILESDELMMLQGKFNKSDLFILSTKPAQVFLNEIKIKLTQGYETDIIITSIVPSLHAQSDSSLSALLFLQYDENFVVNYSNENLHEENLDDGNKNLSNLDFKNENLVLTKAQTILNKEKFTKLVAHKSIVWSERAKKMSILAGNFVEFAKHLNQKIKKRLSAREFEKAAEVTAVVSDSTVDVSPEKEQFYSKPEYTYNYADYVQAGSWKNKIKIVLAVLVFITIAVLVARYFYLDNKALTQVQAEISTIQQNYSNVKTNFAQNPINNRTELKKIIANLEQKEKQFADNKYVTQFEDLKKEAEAYLLANSGVSDLINLPTFYDARLVRSNFLIQDMSLTEDKLLLLDKEQKNLLVVDLATKEVKSKELTGVDNIKDLTAQGERAYFLAQGIKSLELTSEINNDTELKSLKEEGDSNREATVLSVYDNYLYVINPEKRNIYRYVKNSDGDGYSDPIGWIKSATGLDYTQVSSVSIDGDMWLTTADGKLKKFASGRDSNLQITGLENEFSTTLMQYTDTETKNIYILEADKERIVILDKDGNFVKEIHAPELKTATHIVASEAMGKILVSSGALVFEIVL